MKKILIILFIGLFFLSGCSFNTTSQNNNTNTNTVDYDASKTMANNTSNSQPTSSSSPPLELSSFSTKIYDKSSSRQNNIQITISKLNGITITPGSEFSFCEIVGKATPDKGYEKAKIFDKNGKVTEGYGGGNCQVSTTIYNAVKDLPGIEIVEKHEHSNYVPYIEKGLDAAVAYGAEDFKFKNNNTYSIILEIYATENNINVSIKK